MPSDTPKKPQPARPGTPGGARNPLAMIDALIGAPAGAKPERKPKGRSVLLAHALAQRENRLMAEKRAAASKLNAEPAPPASPPSQLAAKPPARPAAAAPAPERPGLDAMIVKALGASARGHVRDGAFDRQGALADLIARTQNRLGTAETPTPEAGSARSLPVPEPRGDREAMIAAAIRTHREQQAVFDELSLRQRATLRATAEAMVAKGAKRASG
ncbi:MAG: hypothetical protein ACFCVH_16040 [Alphaproteobacteria bacterium]